MTATPAEEVLAEIWAIRRDVQRILPGSHVAPHVFPEQILALTRRLDELHTRVRNTFGGTPPRLPDNAVVGPRGRVIPVERRGSR